MIADCVPSVSVVNLDELIESGGRNAPTQTAQQSGSFDTSLKCVLHGKAHASLISTQYGSSWNISIPSFGLIYYSSTSIELEGYQAEDIPPATGWLTTALRFR